MTIIKYTLQFFITDLKVVWWNEILNINIRILRKLSDDYVNVT